MADGSLNFDTRIDSTGVDKGVKNLKTSFDSLINSVRSAGNNTNNAFNKTTGIDKSNSRVKALVDEVDTLKGRLYSLEKQGLYFGDGNYDEAYAKLQAAEHELNDYKRSLAQVERQEKRTANATNKHNNSVKKVSKSTNKAKKETSGLSKSLGLLKMSLGLSIVFMAFQGALSGIGEGINNLAKYSSDFNKTMSSLKSSLTQFKNSIATAFAPILSVAVPYLVTLINYLSKALNTFGKLIAALTGKKTFTQATTVQEDYAKSLDNTSESAEKAKNALYGFDELSVAQKEDSTVTDDGNAKVSDMFETVTISDELTDMAEKIKEVTSSIFKPIQNMLGEIKGAIGAIKDSFIEVWNNGTGEQTLSLLLSIITNISNAIGNIAERFTVAWNEAGLGTQIIQNIADVINILLGYVDRATAAIATWASNIDFTPLLKGIERFTSALKPLAENIGEGVMWFLNEVLLPLASFTISDVLPLFFEGLAAIIGVLNSVIDALQPLASWLWESFLQPIAEWTGGIIIEVLSNLVDGLNGISNWITKHQKLVETIVIIVGSFAASWLLVNVAINAFIAITTILSAVLGTMATAIAFITSPIGLVIIAIGLLIAAIALIVRNWDSIKDVAIKVWDAIVNTWKSAGEWFRTKVVEPIGNFFISLWDGVTNSASKAWDGITKAFKDAGDWFMDAVINPIIAAFTWLWDGIKKIVNGILSMIEGFINAIIRGINFMVDAINSIHLDIPDWIPIVGGKSIGFSLPNISEAKLPRLATGTVVPPSSGEFAAILGDNNKETEVVSPLSTMKRAFKEALAESGNSGSGGNTTINMQVDGKTFAQLFMPYITGENSRKGVTLIEGVSG